MVLVFARKTSDPLVELVKAIDAAVAANSDAKLRGLLTLLGADSADLKENAASLAERAGVKRIPIVVAKEHLTGPSNYRLPGDADVAIVFAKDSQVVVARQFASEQIDMKSVLDCIKQLLN